MHYLNTSTVRNSPPLVDALEVAVDLTGQVAVLRAIKNDLTGHELRKIEYVCEGLIPCIAEILSQSSQSSNDSLPPPATGCTEADEIWVQAAQITGVIANGGPQFTEPILHSQLVSYFLEKLCSSEKPKLSLSILRCLNAIADNLPLANRSEWVADRKLAQQVYNARNADCFTRMIAQASHHILEQHSCNAVLALVCKTCSEERQKAFLIEAGFLSALCRKLSSFIVAEGFVLPIQRSHYSNTDSNTALPEAAPSTAHLSPILECIGCLIENSKPNSEAFLQDVSLSAVLDKSTIPKFPAESRRTPWGSNYAPQDVGSYTRSHSPLETLLPFAPDGDRVTAAEQSGFPPLGSALPNPKRRTSSVRAISEFPSINKLEEDGLEKDEPLVIPWLLYLARAYRKKRRLLAARLLVILQKYDLIQPFRKRSFASLLVPILVQMIDVSKSNDLDELNEANTLSTGMNLHQAAPNLLALAVMDDETLQKAAVDAKAIPKLVGALKTNFEVTEELKEELWWPRKSAKNTTTSNPQSSLGLGGPALMDRNEMVLREGLLQALAAIAPTNDKYRKDICDEGALTQIMLALEPFQGSVIAGQKGNWITLSGNSASTLLAACGTVRALTRSVTSLRTKLVDADVGKAVLKLMNAPDPEVRIAATKVICNLLLDFSPIKQTISESTLIKKLCEQAHSASAQLRFESLWALKSMVYKSPNKLKKEVVDELGPSWIRHLLATDPHDIPPGEVIGLIEREYPKGSMARLASGGLEDIVMGDTSDHYQDQLESTFTRHTLGDDIQIQEQLLGFLSNLFCGEQCAEIVDYVLGEIGSEDFMYIMLERLRSRVYTGPTRRNNQISSAPIGIILTTILVITHVAAANDKFKSLIISNMALLKQLASFCGHQDSSIRTACCWLAINLMYKEKEGDSDSMLKHRAVELQKAGFHTHIRRLETTDTDMDVKERAKSAMLLFNQHLRA